MGQRPLPSSPRWSDFRLASDARPSASRRHIAAVLIAFALLFSTLRVTSYVRKSATWDEPIHLTSGYAALSRGDYRIDPSHPPLARMWAAMPLLFMDVRLDASVIDRTPEQQWLTGPDAYQFARRFLYHDNDGDRLLYAARFMIVLLGVITGIVLFCWMYEWLGFRAAVWAVAFYTISPNLTAHASLVTTDTAETCFLFATTYFVWRLGRQCSLWNLIGLILSCALAVVTKFSGLVLGPVIIVLLSAAVWRGRLSWRQAVTVGIMLAISTYVAIWAAYGFHSAPSTNPAWRFAMGASAGDYLLRPIVEWIDRFHLLPNAFSQGLLYCAVSSIQPAYLLDSYSPSGWWYYFPIAVAVKTPESMLLLSAAGLLLLGRRWRSLKAFDTQCVIVPSGAYLLIAMASGVNVGIRHMLPVFPFMLVLAAIAANRLIESPRRIVRYALAGGVIFWAGSYAFVYPNSLTFFNAIAGGPDRGLAYLADSNLDWGQGLKSLKRWMDRSGIRHINLAYFGQADPGYYRINATLLPGTTGTVAKPQLPGYVAISATMLSGVYLPPSGRLMYRPFRQMTPVARIGHSILVYWIDRWPEATDQPVDADTERRLADSLLALDWNRHALLHYTRYLAVQPQDGRARANVGLIHLRLGQIAEGLRLLREAVHQSPEDAALHRVLGAALLDNASADEARPHVLLAIQTFPEDAMTRCVYGRLLAFDGRWADASREFERALTLDPKLDVAREHLVQARAALGGRGNRPKDM